MNFINYLFFMTFITSITVLSMEPPPKKGPSEDIIEMVMSGQTEPLAQRLQEFDINAQFGDENQTLLHRAVHTRQHGVVSLLLDRGANINALDRNELSPVFHAFQNIGEPGMINMATDLINRGADVTVKSKIRGTSLLHLLARYGSEVNSESLAQLAIKRGADINATDNEGNTATDLALQYGNVALLRALLVAGTPLEAIITPRRSLRSISANQPEIGRLLFIFGAPADDAAIDLLYPLTAALTNRLERQAALCSTAGLNMWLKDKEKGIAVGDVSKALLIAVGRHCLPAVKILIKAGANLSEAITLVDAILSRQTLAPWYRKEYEDVRNELIGAITGYFAKPTGASYIALLPNDLRRIVLSLFTGKKLEGGT